MNSPSRSAPSAERRLFSLVLALLATDVGLTKRQVLSTVYGYSERYREGAANDSLERQFERDKEDLRELGIPLETIDSPEAPGDTQLARYRIPKRDYEVPSDLRFTADELALLALAATTWREGSLSTESRRALMKLRSLGAEPASAVIGYAPRVRVSHPAFDALSRSIEDGAVVTFDYRRPGDRDALRRRVLPLALVQYEGRWHLYGEDRDRRAPRTFLLSRIGGSVRATGERVGPPTRDHAAEAIAGLEELARSRSASLRVESGSEAALQLQERVLEHLPGGDIRVGYVDEAIFADELASFGPEVAVRSPEGLRSAVRERLERVIRAHGGGDDG